MKTFLLPIDFSPITDDLVDQAVVFARAFGGQVHLVHVIEEPIYSYEFALPPASSGDYLRSAEKYAKRKLARYVKLLRAANLEAKATVVQGLTVSGILEEAARQKADYIIMGSHGHGRLFELLVGSTASGVIKRAECAVIILPDAARNG